MRSPRAFIAALVALSLVCLSCASTLPPLPGNQYAQRSEVDVGDYVVTGPPGADWFVRVQKDQGSVGFTKRDIYANGQAGELTAIAVMRNVAAPETRSSGATSELAVATDFMNEQDRLMRGGGGGATEVSDVVRNIEQIGDKKVYSMHFKAMAPQPGVVRESALYLYFPPSFAEKRAYYLFLVSHDYLWRSRPTSSLAPVQDVIESFRLK